MMKVDDSIPLPPQPGRRSKKFKKELSTFEALETGQSFRVAWDARKRDQLRCLLNYYVTEKNRAMGYATRAVIENGRKYLRIWRTK